MPPELAVVVLVAVVLGAALQRVAGLGLGMVAAPIMSLALGPVAGVTLSNVAAVVGAAILLVVMWRDIAWRRFLGLAPLLVLGSIAGAWVVRVVDARVLYVVLGASVLVAIAAVLGLQRHLNATGKLPAVVSGTVGGFMNTTAGVAGPAITVYAVASRWEHRSLAATLQPIFLLANGASIITKAAFGAHPGGDLVPWWAWVLVIAAVPVGVLLGSRLAHRVSLSAARRVAIGVAAVGGAIALIRGLIGLLP